MMNVFVNLVNCEYSPSRDVPVRTSPSFEADLAAYQAEEKALRNVFKTDLLTHYGVTGNTRAEQAFDIAYAREGSLGLYAVADLFKDLLPLFGGHKC